MSISLKPHMRSCTNRSRIMDHVLSHACTHKYVHAHCTHLQLILIKYWQQVLWNNFIQTYTKLDSLCEYMSNVYCIAGNVCRWINFINILKSAQTFPLELNLPLPLSSLTLVHGESLFGPQPMTKSLESSISLLQYGWNKLSTKLSCSNGDDTCLCACMPLDKYHAASCPTGLDGFVNYCSLVTAISFTSLVPRPLQSMYTTSSDRRVWGRDYSLT